MTDLANELTALLGTRIDVFTRFLLAYRPTDGGVLRRRIEHNEISLTRLD